MPERTYKRIYAVRKCSGQWTVSTDEVVCLTFQSYDEAIATAQTAAGVLSDVPVDTREEGAPPGAPHRH